NPIARRILSYMPLPNATTRGAAYAQQNYFIPGGNAVAKDNFYNWVFKVDHNITEKHRIFFRQARNDRTELRTFNGVSGPGEDAQDPLKRINDASVLDWVGTLNPTLIVNVRSSFGRYIENSSGNADRGFDITTLGFPASLQSQLPYGRWFGRY